MSSPYSNYEPVIGLEVHCQLKTKTKLFCGCSNEFGSEPNANTCPVCLAHPGVLPVLNTQAVDYAVRFALAVGAKIREESIFSRKQYFYPDLPKGYQISQFDKPYCEGGTVELSNGKIIELTRAHMEEDAGKNIHGDASSYVDLNRSGVALVEIVTEPVIESAEEASDYLRQLRSIVRYIEICDGNLEEGSFRCDANVSVRKKGDKKLGTRVEIKNLNSFKNVENAIKYEITRQIDEVESGGAIIQSTLQFDPASGKTKAMRSKEDAHDYRYFPEPDLGPLKIDNARIERIKKDLPKLPKDLKIELIEKHGLNEYDASQLIFERELVQYFFKLRTEVPKTVTTKVVCNWVLGDFIKEAKHRQWDLSKPTVSVEDLAELLALLGDKTISSKIAKEVFTEMCETGFSAQKIVKDKNLIQIIDSNEIEKTVEEIIEKHPDQVAAYRSGKDKLFGFFVGQTMKQSGGKFNPTMVNEILKKHLDV